MIYLQYIYRQSGLPQPASIALEIHASSNVRWDVQEEFIYAFPDTKVEFFSPNKPTVDLCIYAFCRDAHPWFVLRWGRQNLKTTRLGLGLFSISERRFIIIPRAQFYWWTIKNWLSYILIIPIKLATSRWKSA